MTSKQKLVVIGNGMAGARAVEEILARGGADQFEITMFGDEPYGNYNRILLSEVLNGSHDAADIFLNPLGWYADNGVKLHAGVRVEKIERHARQVVGENGLTEPYDQLIIATGSVPFIPPIEGLYGADGRYKPGIFVFRSLDDCNRITEYAMDKRAGAVIGGGLLGLEAARGLQNFSLAVHVIQRGNALMSQQLDSPAAAILRTTLEQLGIAVHVDKNTSSIIGEERVVVAMITFGLFTHMACGATYALVPFIDRKSLGGVAGIVGAGGNVGAVGAGFILKASGSVQSCFATLGVIVLAASACAIAVRFTPSHKASEQALYEAALRERELLSAHTGQPMATG